MQTELTQRIKFLESKCSRRIYDNCDSIHNDLFFQTYRADFVFGIELEVLEEFTPSLIVLQDLFLFLYFRGGTS